MVTRCTAASKAAWRIAKHQCVTRFCGRMRRNSIRFRFLRQRTKRVVLQRPEHRGALPTIEERTEMANEIVLCDVAPRDGIQNEKTFLSPAQRCELIRRLAAAGLRWIEVASFASPKWVPQMAGAEEVLR